jgi:bla regulator protein BlaR1
MPFISQSNFLQSLGWAVVNSLWQMALLWMLYKLFVWIIKPQSTLKSKAAFTLLLSGTGWFAFTFIGAFISPSTETLFTWENVSYSLNDKLSIILPYASVVYLLLLLVPVVRFITSLHQVQQLRTKKIQKIEVQWRLFVKKMSGYLEIRKPVQVWISENISTPITVGFLKPVILVPLAAVNKLSPEQMEAVLLHELAHIKRYDYLVNIITVIIKTIFYFNPFTRSIANVIEEEREKSCDEWVLQYQYDAYAYSSALLALEQMKKHSLQLALAAASNKELLLERVKKIMGIPNEPVYSVKNNLKWITGIIGSALLFVALFTNTFKREEKPKQDFSNSLYAFLNSGSNADLNLNYTANLHQANEIRKTLLNKQQSSKDESKSKLAEDYFFDVSNENNPFIRQVSLTEPTEELAELDAEEEVQVKEAVDASKKILKDHHLTELKLAAADVLTAKEQETLKKYYERELAKADWSKLEDKLRTSYDHINWPQVNEKIHQEIEKIRLDSMAVVYNTALNSLKAAKLELQQNNLKGIPDTRYTITLLDSAKRVMEVSLQNIKAVKEKKIIRL